MVRMEMILVFLAILIIIVFLIIGFLILGVPVKIIVDAILKYLLQVP
jgi:hypothetical protein